MPLTPLRLRHPRRLAAQAVDRARVFDTLVNNLEGMAYRCLIDPQWTMVFVSQGCMALTGYAPSELSGDGVVSWEQITHPHDRTRVRAVVQAAADSGQRFHVEYRITTRGGELRRVIERGVGVSDEQGERVTMRRFCSNTPTWPCTRPRTGGATTSSFSRASSTARRTSACAWKRPCATRWSAPRVDLRCITSPRWTTAAASWGRGAGALVSPRAGGGGA